MNTPQNKQWYVLYTPIDFVESYIQAFEQVVNGHCELYKPREYYFVGNRVKSEYVYKNYIYIKTDEPDWVLTQAATIFYDPTWLEVTGKPYNPTDQDIADLKAQYDDYIDYSDNGISINTIVYPKHGPFANTAVLTVNKDADFIYGLTSFREGT